jgi:predicted RNase H-like HicB family nuclease
LKEGIAVEIMDFDVVLEKDSDGWFVASVPALQGCHTQGKTKKEAMQNIKEAILLCLEVSAQKRKKEPTRFISIEKISIHA